MFSFGSCCYLKSFLFKSAFQLKEVPKSQTEPWINHQFISGSPPISSIREQKKLFGPFYVPPGCSFKVLFFLTLLTNSHFRNHQPISALLGAKQILKIKHCDVSYSMKYDNVCKSNIFSRENWFSTLLQLWPNPSCMHLKLDEETIGHRVLNSLVFTSCVGCRANEMSVFRCIQSFAVAAYSGIWV